jgi:hypothetical protein
VVVLWPGAPKGGGDGVALDPPNRQFSRVTCSLMELAGHTLGVWQIWQAGEVQNWLSHVRDLCRIVSYLSEVTLLADLQQDAAAMTPYLLNPAATDSFFRERAGQLRRNWRGSWPVPAVQALAAQHLKVAIDEQTAFRNGLSNLRRDVAGDIASSLDRIGRSASQVQMIPQQKHHGIPAMKYQDRELLVEMLAKAAVNSGNTEIYFKRLIQQANLPPEFKYQRQQFPGPADFEARGLVEWAMGKDVNPNDPRYTTLGSILEPELRHVGLETASAF